VYGRTQDGSAFLVRLQRLQNMLTGAEGDIPLKMKLNAIEWVTFRSINENPSIQRRLELLESQLYGEIFNDMSLVERLDQLLQLMWRSEEHTSELQSRENLVCRLLREKKKKRRWVS